MQFIILIVCEVDYYQVAQDPLVCTACPPGSTTNGNTNSAACGKYGKYNQSQCHNFIFYLYRLPSFKLIIK